MNSYSTSWWSLLLINRPRDDKRLSWPCWLTYSGRFTHINGYPSAAGPVQARESSLVRDRRSTTEPPNQLLRTCIRRHVDGYKLLVLDTCIRLQVSGVNTDTGNDIALLYVMYVLPTHMPLFCLCWAPPVRLVILHVVHAVKQTVGYTIIRRV